MDDIDIFWAGLLYIKDRKVLMVKEYKHPFLMIPGGKIEEGETDEQTVQREIIEETGITPKNLKHFDSFVLPTRTRGKALFKVYTGDLDDKPHPTETTEAIHWINSSYEKKGIDVGNPFKMHLCEKLKALDLID